MKAIIIEDEELTADRLARMVKQNTHVETEAILHSVKSSLEWLAENECPDLIFLDVQLGDGSGFDVLDHIETYPNIIFTTAFDKYAIEAFKYNSVDYLLKPIKVDDLKRAIEKLDKISTPLSPDIVSQLKSKFTEDYKQKFLVKIGHKYHSYNIDEIAYFYSEEGDTYLKTKAGERSIMDYPLDTLDKILDPEKFFRVNRHLIVGADQIATIDSYFNNRLSLELQPAFHENVIVSRDRVKSFKRWMGE